MLRKNLVRAGEVSRYTVGTGLTLLVEHDQRLPVVAARLLVSGGSVAEQPEPGRGIAHLAEHVVGTTVAQALHRCAAGALVRASTTREHISFGLVCQIDRLLVSLRHLLAVPIDPAQWASCLDEQRQVVLEEIRLFEKDPVRQLQQAMLEALYTRHPLRAPICGYPSQVIEVTADQIGQYLERTYTAGGTCLAVVGAVDPDALAEQVAAMAEAIPPGPAFCLDPQRQAEPPLRASRHAVPLHGKLPGLSIIGYRTVGCESDDLLALEALDHEIGRSFSSDRAGAEQGPVQRAVVQSSATRFGTGYLSVMLKHAPGQHREAEEEMLSWLDGVADGRIEARAAAPQTTPVIRPDATLESAEERAMMRCLGELYRGDPELVDQLRQEIPMVEATEIRRVAAAYCRPQTAVIAHVTARAPGRPIADRPEDEQAPKQQELANGVRTLIVPGDGRLACCQVVWHGGVLAEDARTSGLSALMASQLPESVPPELGEQLRSYTRRSGALLYSFGDPAFGGISMTTSPEQLADGIDLMTRIVVQPAFQQEVMERHRQAALRHLANDRVPLLHRCLLELKRRMYPDQPLGSYEVGEVASVTGLSLQDVIACHRRLLVGGSTVAVVAGSAAGDRSIDQALVRLEQLPAGTSHDRGSRRNGDAQQARPAQQAPPAEAAPPQVVAAGLDPSQALTALGFSGIAWTSRTWCALVLIKAVLVGSRDNAVNARLMVALRRAGLAYTSTCVLQLGLVDGFLALLTESRPGATGEVLEVMQAEIERLRSGDLDPRELEQARQLLLLDDLMLRLKPRSKAYFEATKLLLGEPTAPLDLAAELASFTPADLVDTAQRYLGPASRTALFFEHAPAGNGGETEQAGQPARGT